MTKLALLLLLAGCECSPGSECAHDFGDCKGEVVKTTDNIAYGYDCYRDENGECHYFPTKPPGYWDKFTKGAK